MEIVKRKLSELSKMEKNIRKHSQKQIEEYARSVKMFGQIRPIVCDENGVILAGNGLYEALKLLGIDTADCYVVNGLTETQKKKLMLADNKIYDLGINDLNAFQDVIMELDGDFDVPGWDFDLLKILTSAEDELSQTVTQYGMAEAVDDVSESQEPEVYEPVEYKPVVRDEQTGEILNPHVNETETKEKPVERPFVICPKCGEKIWL